MKYKKFVISGLEEASKIASRNFGKVVGTTKPEDNNQVLTETDLEVGKVLVERVLKKFPKHNVIDEEAGVIDNGSEFTWVIDPIDGTSNFAAGLPLYGIMMGLLENDQPVVGGVALPAFNEIYFAAKDQGAFCNGKRIRVTKEKELSKSLVCWGIDGYQNNPDKTRRECQLLAEIVLRIRNFRSSNSIYDGMMVAKGVYGAYLHTNYAVWDIVAKQIIVEEAGGLCTDFWGKKIDYAKVTKVFKKKDRVFTSCAAAPELHEQLQKIIRGFDKEKLKPMN